MSKSSAEGFPAGAGCCSIGVVDFKACLFKRFNIIDLRPGDIKRALGVDDDFYLLRFNKDVPVSWRILKVHLILKSGASSPDYCNSQYTIGSPLAFKQGTHLIRCTGCQLNQPLITHSHRARFFLLGCRSRNHSSKIRSGPWRVNQSGNILLADL